MSLSPQAVPQKSWHRIFPGTMSEIPSAASWVESITTELVVPESQAFAMQVCLEELLSNIVRHGSKMSNSPVPQTDSVKPLEIAITVTARADRITMTVEDNGRPFDIAEAPAKAIDRTLERVELGGLGIHLIKSFASDLEYDRTEAGNRVLVEFRA
jgi:serine/threonine-protein kinase RsbW